MGLERDCEGCPLDWFVRAHRRNPASAVKSIEDFYVDFGTRFSLYLLFAGSVETSQGKDRFLVDVLAQQELRHLSRLATTSPLRCSDVFSDSLTLRKGGTLERDWRWG